jgi:hypothetical protein
MTCRRTRLKNYVDEEAKRKNTTKSRVRAKVEHPFRMLKRIFGFDKVRYRGLTSKSVPLSSLQPLSSRDFIEKCLHLLIQRPTQSFLSDYIGLEPDALS